MIHATDVTSTQLAFEPAEQRVTLPNGVTLSYLESGDVTGSPVVLLHGLAGSARSFEGLLQHLPIGVHAFAISFRGHGGADRPLSGYGSSELAADVIAFLDTVGVGQAALVGHSMGAHAALRLAARYPERVSGAVLIGAAPPLPGHRLVHELNALFGTLVDPIDEAFIVEFLRRTMARPVDAAVDSRLIEEGRKIPARVWQESWAGMRDAEPIENLTGITVPVHLAWGAQDTLIDRTMQHTVHRAIPDATVHHFAAAGHAPHLDDPEGVAAYLVDVLGATPVATAVVAPEGMPTAPAVQPASTSEVGSVALDERLTDATIGALELFGVYLGTRLALYQTLHELGPLTSAELAAAAGIDRRYAREWCEQQAVAGMLHVDDPGADEGTRRYRLPAQHAAVLVDTDDPAHVAPFADAVVGVASALDEVVDAYRSGAGVPYAHYGEAFRRGQGGINRPAFSSDLLAWLAAAGLDQRLARPGSRLADVGCGQGWSTISVARAYPHADVVGYDLDGPSIADARRFAEARGSTARFVAADVATLAGDGPFDVVLLLETLHDLAHPVDALRSCRAALHDAGAVLVADEAVADRFTAPGDQLERLMYGWSISHCLPSARVDGTADAIGTVLRADTLRALALEAGFQAATPLDVDAGFFRLYLLTP
jgi:pimeloyl-ACP methyl ester carboxylesterase/2-polyprenyl-3-methyl-5-hydroxy-6-metoxy-1,4-benzoquinol methylase